MIANQFDDFDKLKTDRRTMMCHSNIILNIKNVYNNLCIAKYKIMNQQKEDTLSDGSIIQLRYGNNVKGIISKENKKICRNILSVVLIVENRKLTLKLPESGNSYIMNCKSFNQAQKAMLFMWDKIMPNKNLYRFRKNQSTFEFIIIPTLCHIKFNLNISLKRQQFEKYFRENSLLYPNIHFGPASVHIKVPVDTSIQPLQLHKIIVSHNNIIREQQITYNDYLNALCMTDKLKKINKPIFNTFLVFYSGNVIMSGIDLTLMRDTYNVFLNIITDYSKRLN